MASARSTVDAFVSAVERRIGAILAPSATEPDRNVFADASRHLCLGGGGKRVRARLVRLLGEAVGVPDRDLEDIAVAAELIHAASLLHDDVVDDGHLRRGRPTVNAAWGNAVAVLAGDWLLSTGFSVLDRHPRAVTTEAIEVLRSMSQAAIAELEARGRVDLTPEAWRAIAEGKTGRLFAWCGRATARLSGHSELIEPFSWFGLRLGVAFQLADDLKDLWGGEPGKDRFSDLRNRNPSMPILLATQRSAALREQIASAWARPPLDTELVDALGQAVLASGAERIVVEGLSRETTAAVEALGPHRDQPWCEEIIRLARSFGPGFSAAAPSP